MIRRDVYKRQVYTDTLVNGVEIIDVAKPDTQLLNVVRTTVFRHRKSALAQIKPYLEGKADDEYR